MQSVCLSDFPFAIDGKKVEHFKSGDKRDFELHTESLTKKGYLAPAISESMQEATITTWQDGYQPSKFGKKRK